MNRTNLVLLLVLLGSDLADFGDGFSYKQLGQQRGTGDRWRASAGAETRGSYAAIFHTHGKGKRIAADGVGYLDFDSGIRQITDIAGIFVVIEHFWAVHNLSIPSGLPQCNTRRPGRERVFLRPGTAAA